MKKDIEVTIAHAADAIAKQKRGAVSKKPQTALFKGPRGSTGRRIGDSDEQPPADAPRRSS
jgi:hypothetical protein